VKERPILFSAPMVRAILAGQETQTRRIVKTGPQFREWGKTVDQAYDVLVSDVDSSAAFLVAGDHGYTDWVPCPYGTRGDRLWVKETHVYRDKHNQVYYRADSEFDPYAHNGWRPSIFMPRKWSRINLDVTAVRVETLHSISSRDAVAEGVIDDAHSWDGNPTYPLARYKSLWHEINGEESWDANPWVWVVEFKRAEQ
jgi:hypothetical protein